ncbi:integrase core domain-containing protein [Thiopseudomonas alkaliphila]|uniref:integrase core domain-containing protein n=1 Tax=Thiopseudomonas alkaliphila TaxID=1697053 RepID=UPI00258170AD|nr:transposase [Thiopseudomonas alkaliphila]
MFVYHRAPLYGEHYRLSRCLVSLDHYKPNQNTYIERFNKSYRNEALDAHLFSRLILVRYLNWTWMISYNKERSRELDTYIKQNLTSWLDKTNNATGSVV